MKWLFVLFFLFLTGCQPLVQSTSFQQSAKDGAPKGPIPTHFKAVVPKHEPLSRYGNPSAYRVNGHTYDVMTSASGYKQRGLASWYGTKFHAKRTSSGEPYDMYALTAAHRTLPLPTYIRVKNLSNGKEAVVKVNDRGPFHSNRILDLSYGAAVKLGLFPKGTAMIEIEALNVARPGQSKVAQYYVQAGAFNSKNLAYDMKNKLSKITSSRANVEAYQQRYLVKFGPFSNKRDSDRMRSLLQRHGYNAFSVLM